MKPSTSLFQILTFFIVYGSGFIQMNAIDYEIPSSHQDEIASAVEKLDCIEFRSSDGVFSSGMTDEPSTTTCGLYLVGDISSRVKVEFLEFNVDCTFGNMIGVLDGWEQRGSTFPPAEDLSARTLRNRYSTYCGAKRPLKTFYSSGNFALIQYKLRKPNHFVVRVTFEENPRPCNTVALGNEGQFELHNRNQRINCSVMIIHPQQIQINFMNVGKKTFNHGRPVRRIGHATGSKHGLFFEKLEPTILESCNPVSYQADYVEILGGNNWSVRDMYSFGPLCGMAEMIEPKNIFCETTVVRLVSSGQYDNVVVVEHSTTKKETGNDVGVCPV